MYSLKRIRCAAGCAAAIGFLTIGCSTVLNSDNAANDRSAAIERAALITAAAAVSETKWPAMRSASWGSRLAGSARGDAGKDEAVAAYLASLGPRAERQSSIFADAERQLRAGDVLIGAALAAADAVRPVKADVAIVETAIGDLRESRDIYVASLKAVARDGEIVDSADMRALKAAFNDAIEELGAAADGLADQVARDRTETYARPNMRRSVGGSL